MNPNKLKTITVRFLPHVGREPVIVSGYGNEVGYGVLPVSVQLLGCEADCCIPGEETENEGVSLSVCATPTYKVWHRSKTFFYPSSVIAEIEADV